MVDDPQYFDHDTQAGGDSAAPRTFTSVIALAYTAGFKPDITIIYTE